MRLRERMRGAWTRLRGLGPRMVRFLAYARFSKKRVAVLLLASVVLAACGAVGVAWITCPAVDSLIAGNPATTSLIARRQRQGKAPRRLPPLNRTFVPLKAIPEPLQQAVIVAEDAGFYGHAGIDWYEVRQAFKQNLHQGRVVRGASTITQQLAKNLYLSEERSAFRKLQEWILAGRLEGALSKRRILELYLNVIEFGPGVFGIGPACRSFFGKAPAELSLPEMVRLAAVIPEPLRLAPHRRSDRLVKRARIILERLLRFGYINHEAFASAGASLDTFLGTETEVNP